MLNNNNFANKDDIETSKIDAILKYEFNLYESEEERIKRQAVLSKLKSIIRSFVFDIGTQKGIPPEECSYGGNIYAYGSYRLGVHAPGSDIDVLFVAPNYIDRQKDFFGDFLERLKVQSDITELCDVPGAYVPVIKMKFSGIPIDLVFANIHFKLTSSEINLQDDNILTNCDKESILSLNGSRVTDMILNLVNEDRIEYFKMTLKAIKKWAKARGLYSNAFGFLGGINYAILVAKIIQLNPTLKPNKLLSEFFKVYSTWKFDKEPITLTEIVKDKGFKVELEAFNPDNSKVTYQMAIVTPAFPAFNSTHNVSETTKRIMIKEFEFSYKITKLIEEGKLPWMALFQKINIFKMYKGFIQVDILSSNQEDFKKWFGFIESKLRRLVRSMEDANQIKFHPFPQDFETTNDKFKFCKTFFFGINFINPKLLYGNDVVISDNHLKINLRDATIKFLKEKDISDPKNRNKATMNLRIRDVDNKELPNSITRQFDFKPIGEIKNNNLNSIISNASIYNHSDYEYFSKLEIEHYLSNC